MKRKTPVKLIGYLLCVALLCGLLAGCGNDKVQEEQNDNICLLYTSPSPRDA